MMSKAKNPLSKTAGYRLFQLLKRADEMTQATTPAQQPNTQVASPIQAGQQPQQQPMKSGIGVTQKAPQATSGTGGVGGSGIKPLIVNPYLNFSMNNAR